MHGAPPGRGTAYQEFWYSIAAYTAPFFRLGEWLESGAALGESCFDGQPVRAEASGQVVSIQYDIWQERVILVLASAGPEQGRQP